MVLSNFISVMYECFGSKIFVDDYEIIQKSYNKADMLKGVLSKFIIEDDSDFILFEGLSDDYLSKVYKGIKSLSVNQAVDIKSRMDLDTFAYFYENADLPTDQIDELINSFEKYNIKISKPTIEKDIFNVLKDILNNIIDKKEKISIRMVEIIGKIIKFKNKILKVNTDVVYDENDENSKYIEELINVYKIESHIEINSEDEISKLPLYYRQHFKLQKENFYCAMCALKTLKTLFYDGLDEFNHLKEEIHESIEEILIYPYTSPLEKVNDLLDAVSKTYYSKSYLSKAGNGLIGVKERKGIIYILVNEGLIHFI